MKIKNEKGIIVALDTPDIDKTFEILHSINNAKGNFAFKVGRPLEMKYGINVISQIRAATDLPIIYDGKIADIPHISAQIAEMAYNAGADAVIAHSFVGNDVIEAIVNLAMGDVITVIEMSHPGWVKSAYRRVTTITDMISIGVSGLVLPATDTKVILSTRNILNSNNSNIYIVSPGVGAQGTAFGVATGAGGDYEIIGRSICDTKYPKKMAEYCMYHITNSLEY